MTIHQKRNSKKSHWKKKNRRTRDNNDGIVVGGADYKQQFQTLFSSTIQQITAATNTEDIENKMKVFITEFIKLVNEYDRDNQKNTIVTIDTFTNTNDINEKFIINKLLPKADIIDNFVSILQKIKSKLPADKSCHSFITDLFLEYIDKSFDSSDYYYYEKEEENVELYEFGDSAKYNTIRSVNYYDEYVQLYNKEEPNIITEKNKDKHPLYKSTDDNAITNDIRIGRFLLHAFIKAALKVCGKITYGSIPTATPAAVEPTPQPQPTDKLDFRITFLRYLDLLEGTTSSKNFQEKFPDVILSGFAEDDRTKLMEFLKVFFENKTATQFIDTLNKYFHTKFAIIDAIKSVITTENADGTVGINEQIIIKTQKEPEKQTSRQITSVISSIIEPITVSLDSEGITNLQYLFENEKYNQLLAKDIIAYYKALFSKLKAYERLLSKPPEEKVQVESEEPKPVEMIEFDFLKYDKYNELKTKETKNKKSKNTSDERELNRLKNYFDDLDIIDDFAKFKGSIAELEKNNIIKEKKQKIEETGIKSYIPVINSLQKPFAFRPPPNLAQYINQTGTIELKPIDTTRPVETSINHKDLITKFVDIMSEANTYDEINQRIPELFLPFSSSIAEKLNKYFSELLQTDSIFNKYQKYINEFFELKELFKPEVKSAIIKAVTKIGDNQSYEFYKKDNIKKNMKKELLDIRIDIKKVEKKGTQETIKMIPKTVGSLVDSIFMTYDMFNRKVFEQLVGVSNVNFTNELKTAKNLKELANDDFVEKIRTTLTSNEIPEIDKAIKDKDIKEKSIAIDIDHEKLKEFVSKNIPNENIRSVLKQISTDINKLAPAAHEIIGVTPVVVGTDVILHLTNNAKNINAVVDFHKKEDEIKLQSNHNILLFLYYAYYSYHIFSIKVEPILALQQKLEILINKIKYSIMIQPSQVETYINQAKELAVKLVLLKQVYFDLVDYIDYIQYHVTSEDIVKPDVSLHDASEQAKYKQLYNIILTNITTGTEANTNDILPSIQEFINESQIQNPNTISVVRQIISVIDEITKSP